MVTRTVEYCSLKEVPEADVLSMLSQILSIIEPETNADMQPLLQWIHQGTRDGRSVYGHDEVIETYRTSLTKHFDIRKEVAKRFIDTQFGPVQMSDRLSYIAMGQGENLHFELFVNADGHNTVHFMVTALPEMVDRYLELFHQRFQ